MLDRATGEFLLGKPFVKVNWASGLDAKGRPIQTPQPPGAPTWPGNQGATNWYSPSYSPRTGLFYVPAWENYATIYRREEASISPGRYFLGGGFTRLRPGAGAPPTPSVRRGPINNWTDAVGNGAVIAIDPQTGEHKWKFKMTDVTDSGHPDDRVGPAVHRRPRGLFPGARRARRQAAVEGHLGGQIVMAPVTYMVDGKQYLSVISGKTW